MFVAEFVTGGGLRREALPASLAHEGALMRGALVRDLSDLPGVDVISTFDDRVAAPDCEAVPIHGGDDPWTIWAQQASGAEVAWVVAPETGGALARLTRLMRTRAAQVVGPDDEAIRIASSKALTAERLIQRGVATPPVWRPGEVPAAESGPFVVKPDDGAGCDATWLVDGVPAKDQFPAGHVVQRLTPGEPASLTVLRDRGTTTLLAVNRQHILIEHGVVSFRGLSVAGLGDPDGSLGRLAESVVDALPGLAGIFGIDIVLGPDRPVVIEVNPRLTTAYAGLRQAIDANPAALVAPFGDSGATLRRAPLRRIEIAL